MKNSLAPIGTGTIEAEESLDFARLSGDFNPLHLDPEQARRYQFGSTVIHGVNGTLRALEYFCAAQPNRILLTSLKVNYLRPAHQGDRLTVVAEQQSPTAALVKVLCQDREVQTIDLSFAPQREDSDGTAPPPETQHNHSLRPVEPGINDVASLAGSVPLSWNHALFSRLFPKLADKLSAAQCATLLTSTYLVGMKCPGLNSIYAGLELTFNTAHNGPVSELDYSVEDVDIRFSRIVIALSNPTVSGSIVAFFRPTPVTQTSFREICSLVNPDQFSRKRALIVGGSRGLGEVIAKILAAGGAATTITYAKGLTDAQRVVDEISAGGGLCELTRYDVFCNDELGQRLIDAGGVDHIYYMASPVIQRNDASLWDANLFQRYSHYYIRGLSELLAPLTKVREQRNARLGIYLPSTVFLDRPEKGFSEYIAAKAATESFAMQLRALYPNWRVHTPRLPRMLTDQTSAITDLDKLDTVRHILSSLPAED